MDEKNAITIIDILQVVGPIVLAAVAGWISSQRESAQLEKQVEQNTEAIEENEEENESLAGDINQIKESLAGLDVKVDLLLDDRIKHSDGEIPLSDRLHDD